MKSTLNKVILSGIAASFMAVSAVVGSTAALADNHAMVKGSDQDMSGGTVTAEMIMAPANGWLVVHRSNAEMKPSAVIGYAPLMEGVNTDVTVTLTEPVASGEELFLMLHSEEGGMMAGTYEFTAGGKEDVPVMVDGKPVMVSITAE